MNIKGSWHIYYLFLFYLSMTFCLLFSYLVAQSYKWLNISGGLLHRALLNGSSELSKKFLFLLAVFFVMNTIYLIKRRY